MIQWRRIDGRIVTNVTLNVQLRSNFLSCHKRNILITAFRQRKPDAVDTTLIPQSCGDVHKAAWEKERLYFRAITT